MAQQLENYEIRPRIQCRGSFLESQLFNHVAASYFDFLSISHFVMIDHRKILSRYRRLILD